MDRSGALIGGTDVRLGRSSTTQRRNPRNNSLTMGGSFFLGPLLGGCDWELILRFMAFIFDGVFWGHFLVLCFLRLCVAVYLPFLIGANAGSLDSRLYPPSRWFDIE
ncbi:hypothetical protein BJX64DRAFT_266309 [Aspergillus heterothallicus]